MSEEVDKVDELVEDVEVEDEEIQEESSVEEGYDKKKKSAMKNEEEMEDEEEDEEEEEVSEASLNKPFSDKDHADADKWADKIEADAKNIAKTPSIFLQYLQFHNMGVSGTKPHPAVKGIEAEMKKRGLKAVEDEVGMKIFEAKNFDSDLQALVESEATLSEGFKDKAAIIFEAALKSKLKIKEENLKEQYETKLNEEVETYKNELVEKVDSYLNYTIQSWLEENKLQIQNNLRNEIAENFINQLKEVFVENYIEVPDSKIDIVDQLADEVVELEEKLDTTLQREIKLNEELNSFKKEAILREHSIGMAETEFEKLKSLTEDIEFVNEEVFKNKVEVIKENYFGKTSAPVQEEILDEAAPVQVSSSIDAYLKAIKSNKNFS